MGAEEGPKEGLANHILACSDEANDTLKENDFTACKEPITSYITLIIMTDNFFINSRK